MLRRSKASRPGGSVLDKRSCEGDAASVRVADSVGSARVGDTADIVDVLILAARLIIVRNYSTVAIAHYLHVLAFIRRGGVAVVAPEERAYLHFVRALIEHLISVGGYLHYLGCAQLLYRLVVELGGGEGLKCDTVAVICLSDYYGESADLVSRGYEVATLLKNEYRGCAYDLALRVADALGKALLFIDESRDKLGCIYRAARHCVELSVTALDVLFYELLGVVYHTDNTDCVLAEARAYEQRLRRVVTDTTYRAVAIHLVEYVLKLGSEW